MFKVFSGIFTHRRRQIKSKNKFSHNFINIWRLRVKHAEFQFNRAEIKPLNGDRDAGTQQELGGQRIGAGSQIKI